MCTLQTSYLGHHQKFQRKNDLDALVYTFLIFLFCRLISQCLTQAPSKNIDKLDDRTQRDKRIERHFHIEHSLTRLTSLCSSGRESRNIITVHRRLTPPPPPPKTTVSVDIMRRRRWSSETFQPPPLMERSANTSICHIRSREIFFIILISSRIESYSP